jgi:predicted RNA binding protein YcfA (HicA-like mRNA interferase family)
MKPISGKKFEKILKKNGWILLRVHGSHHIYGKEGSIVRLSVPIHGNTPLKAGLLTHLAKMAGLTEDELK